LDGGVRVASRREAKRAAIGLLTQQNYKFGNNAIKTGISPGVLTIQQQNDLSITFVKTKCESGSNNEITANEFYFDG
jgi:hypothetical protein